MSIFGWFHKKTPHTSLLPAGLFTSAYLLVATPLAYSRHNTEFLFYIAIVVVVGAIVAAVHRKVNFSHAALFMLSAWGFFHMIGGLVHVPATWVTENGSGVLYSWWIIPGYFKYDNFAHAYGFFVATWVTWECVKSMKGVTPSTGIFVLCWLAGMGLGALNEVIEFSAVLLIPNTNVGGYVNTGWDLVANMVGAGAAVIIAKATTRK